MAGDWIKMRLDLQTHPKIVRILSATESDKFRVIGGLHAVWSVFDTHSTDGTLPGYSAKTLDHIIGWPGFSAAMIGVGWLAEGPQVLVLPDFSEHNGKGGKRRAEDQKRKRDDRKNPDSVRNLSANDSDENRTREEKRREENTSTGADAPEESFPEEERRQKRQPSDADFDAARWLFDVTLKINPEAKKPKWDKWASDVRLLREVDGRTHRQICELFKWAKSDPFWSPNIQSPAKLRDKWDTLTEKRIQAGEGDAPAKKDWI